MESPNSYEARKVKPLDTPVIAPPKEKKKFIPPEQKAKQKLAENLFGGKTAKPPMKGP